MTTVFPPSGKVDMSSAGTHVLMISVGGYAHLLGGDPEQRLRNPMGLSQLSSPPLSANALANWFLGRQAHAEAKHGFNNSKAPLASIEMLVSPPWQQGTRPRPHRYLLAAGDEIALDGASREQIRYTEALAIDQKVYGDTRHTRMSHGT